MSDTYTDDLYDDQDHWPPCRDESCPWCYPQSPEPYEDEQPPSLFGPAVRFIREKQAAGYSTDQILKAWMMQEVELGS
jgi:hypothetical protein